MTASVVLRLWLLCVNLVAALPSGWENEWSESRDPWVKGYGSHPWQDATKLPSELTTPPMPAQALKVVVYNLQNYEGPWRQRFKAITGLIKEEDAHIVGFQEIRRRSNGADDELALLKQLLPRYTIEFMAGMKYPGGVEEGVAVASRLPVRAQKGFRLPRLAGSSDVNARAAVRCEVQVAPEVWVEFVGSHLSYGKNQRLPQVKLLAKEADEKHGSIAAQIMVADWNFYHAENPDEVFLVRSGYRDAWLEANPNLTEAQSFTFSTSDPHNRPNRIFMRSHGECSIEAKTVRRIGQARVALSAGARPRFLSDHMGLAATLEVKCD